MKISRFFIEHRWRFLFPSVGFIIGAAISVAIGVAIGWASYWFFNEPVIRQVHLQATPNWVHMVTSRSKFKEAIGLPSYDIEGVSVDLIGSFRALCLLRKATTRNVSEVKVHDNERNKDIMLNVDLPAVFSIEEDSKNVISRAYFRVSAPQGGLYFRRYEPEELAEKPFGEEHPISEEHPALFFSLPPKYVLYIKFVESDVSESTLDAIPREFDIRAPLSVESGVLQQKLAVKSANTILFSIYENVEERKRVQQSPDFFINATNLVIRTKSTNVSLGSLKRSGGFTSYLPKPKNMFSVWLKRNLRSSFHLAVTLEKASVKEEPSWLGIKGGVKHIFLSGPSCVLSLGRDRFDLSSTDRIEILGDLIMSLDYRPGSLPQIQIDGKAISCTVNGEELLPTRWGTMNTNVKGGIVGGAIGFLLSLILNIGFRNRSSHFLSVDTTDTTRKSQVRSIEH